MKITHPLNNILDNEAKVRILRFLCRTGAHWNGRQIAKEIGVTPATAHKALQGLYSEGVLSLHNIGKTHVYSLNGANSVVSGMLKPLFAKEGRVLDDIIGIIQRRIASSSARKSIISAALFGSIKTGQDHAASDIDIAVIVETAAAKAAAERLFEDMDKKISGQFGNTLSPYINTKTEFRAKHKKGLAVVKSIIKSHKVIYGKELNIIL